MNFNQVADVFGRVDLLLQVATRTFQVNQLVMGRSQNLRSSYVIVLLLPRLHPS